MDFDSDPVKDRRQAAAQAQKKGALPLRENWRVKSMRPRPARIPATGKRSAVGYGSKKRLGKGSDLTNNGDEIRGLFEPLRRTNARH